MSIYTVYLRQPDGLDDRRCDPFWEFGSFGSTGCHSSNLLHPKRSPLSAGDRLLFLQGSRGEVRAVALTPPIKVGGQASRLEALWDPTYRALPFEKAALFIDNARRTDFPALLPMLDGVRCDTPCSAVGSKFRSLCKPIQKRLADEVVAWFSGCDVQIEHYFEAVCGPDTPWRRVAAKSGWSEKNIRQGRYEQFRRTSDGSTADESPIRVGQSEPVQRTCGSRREDGGAPTKSLKRHCR